MKRFILGLLLTCLMYTIAWGQNPRQIALNILKKYSPEGYYIIETYSNSDSKYHIRGTTITTSKTDFMVYINGKNPLDILEDLETAVHEICHSFTHNPYPWIAQDNTMIWQSKDHYSAFYIKEKQTILVKHTPIFNSKEIANTIPQHLRTFRFETYIYPGNNPTLGSQIDGVYGLLDEFNAYYHGTKTAVDLYGYYKNELPQTPENYLQFLSMFTGVYLSHLEFKFYILNYLLYSQKKYPDIFKGIIENKAFVKVFLTIDALFQSLNEKYFALKRQIINYFKARGYDAGEDENYISLDGRHKQGNFMDVYMLLRTELEKAEYQTMMEKLREQ